MSVEHQQSQKEIKINDKYSLNIESKWEDGYSWDEVNLTDGINCIEVGNYYTAGTPYEREWLEYNDDYVAIIHQNLISGVITIEELIDLQKFEKIKGTPERVKDYYNMFKKVNVSNKGSSYLFNQTKLNKNTSILIESKTNAGICTNEVAIETLILKDVQANIQIGENGPLEVNGCIGRHDYLGPQVTFDNNGLRGWVEYNNQYVAFVDYIQATGQRRVNRIFDISEKCFLDVETCELDRIYKQSFAPEFIFRQPIKIPVKKLELKNNCIKN